MSGIIGTRKNKKTRVNFKLILCVNVNIYTNLEFTIEILLNRIRPGVQLVLG